MTNNFITSLVKSIQWKPSEYLETQEAKCVAENTRRRGLGACGLEKTDIRTVLQAGRDFEIWDGEEYSELYAMKAKIFKSFSSCI